MEGKSGGRCIENEGGMLCSFFFWCCVGWGDFLGVESTQGFPVRPLDVRVLPGHDGADPGLRLADGNSDLGLRQAGGTQLANQELPVHAGIIRMLLAHVNSFLIHFLITILI